ncbi:MAG TPA: preprotein translocase subunit SecG [Chitinophagaceae bacterium]|nr:preprotein translocase subunit SecG [Chitinophagaceae bacterium]
MTLFFFILVALSCFLLAFFVLVQNPKGGGLAGTIGGFNSQIMGVKQTNDVLEKGTWLFAIVIGLLCILSTAFIRGSSATINNLPVTQQQAQPAGNTTVPATQPATTK